MHSGQFKDWQLMEKPISLQEFEDLPLLRSTFFHFGLGLEGTNAASIISCNERYCIQSIF